MDKLAQNWARKIVDELAAIKKLLRGQSASASTDAGRPIQEGSNQRVEPDRVTEPTRRNIPATGKAQLGSDIRQPFGGLARARPIIDILGVTVVTLYTVLTFFILRSARKSNELAHDSIRITQRPWVGISDERDAVSMLVPLKIDGNGNAITTFTVSTKKL